MIRGDSPTRPVSAALGPGTGRAQGACLCQGRCSACTVPAAQLHMQLCSASVLCTEVAAACFACCRTDTGRQGFRMLCMRINQPACRLISCTQAGRAQGACLCAYLAQAGRAQGACLIYLLLRMRRSRLQQAYYACYRIALHARRLLHTGRQGPRGLPVCISAYGRQGPRGLP